MHVIVGKAHRFQPMNSFRNKSWMASLSQQKEQGEWKLAHLKAIFSMTSVWISISPLVSHDYFPVLRAPVTLPCNCICNSSGLGRIKMRSMFFPAPSGSGALGVRNLSRRSTLLPQTLIKHWERETEGWPNTHIKIQRHISIPVSQWPRAGWKSALAVQATGPIIKGDIPNCTSTHYSGAGITRGTSGLSNDKHFSWNFTSHCRLRHFTNSVLKNIFTYAGGKTLTYFSNAIYTKQYKKAKQRYCHMLSWHHSIFMASPDPSHVTTSKISYSLAQGYKQPKNHLHCL